MNTINQRTQSPTHYSSPEEIYNDLDKKSEDISEVGRKLEAIKHVAQSDKGLFNIVRKESKNE